MRVGGGVAVGGGEWVLEMIRRSGMKARRQVF